MYRVIREFADLQDNNHVYRVGDKFPRSGHKVSKQRSKELETSANKIGEPLIEKEKKNADRIVQGTK